MSCCLQAGSHSGGVRTLFSFLIPFLRWYCLLGGSHLEVRVRQWYCTPHHCAIYGIGLCSTREARHASSAHNESCSMTHAAIHDAPQRTTLCSTPYYDTALQYCTPSFSTAHHATVLHTILLHTHPTPAIESTAPPAPPPRAHHHTQTLQSLFLNYFNFLMQSNHTARRTSHPIPYHSR